MGRSLKWRSKGGFTLDTWTMKGVPLAPPVTSAANHILFLLFFLGVVSSPVLCSIFKGEQFSMFVVGNKYIYKYKFSFSFSWNLDRHIWAVFFPYITLFVIVCRILLLTVYKLVALHGCGTRQGESWLQNRLWSAHYCKCAVAKYLFLVRWKLNFAVWYSGHSKKKLQYHFTRCSWPGRISEEEDSWNSSILGLIWPTLKVKCAIRHSLPWGFFLALQYFRPQN